MAIDESGRPTDLLPKRELFRLSLYWLGLSSIFAGLGAILQGRLIFDGLVPDATVAGRTLFLLTIGGAFIAIVVQPTIGSISDYTITRWGRRKPYILIGSILDVVFLIGIAMSSGLIAIAAFVALSSSVRTSPRDRSRATSPTSSPRNRSVWRAPWSG